MVKLNLIDGKKHLKCTLMPHNHDAQEHKWFWQSQVFVYLGIQLLGSLKAAKRCLILARDQSVHQVSLWQRFVSKIPLRCEETLSSLGHLTPVAGGGLWGSTSAHSPQSFPFFPFHWLKTAI